MLKSSKVIFYITLFLLSINLFGQESKNTEEYFFPVRPNESNYLSGTMGEIRGTHFHAGMDVKTSGRSGLPVYATMDGHVSRIKVSSGGYGHALYILHNNGETSVYGHLLRFREDIGKYVREKQYEKESFQVDLFPDKSVFQVKKGDLIGLSGNTGSSQGPHLHFEIRDENQRPKNPLKKNFSEIKDNIPPILYEFALKTMDIHSRINNEFGRVEFNVRKNGKNYYYDEPITVYGKIGLQIKAYDKLNGALNRNGIPYISVEMDEEKIFSVQIDSFSFSDTRHVVNYYDFEARRHKNGTFQKMYLDDGNKLPLYPVVKDNGFIIINDEDTHNVKVYLKDVYGNESVFSFELKGTRPETHLSKISDRSPDKIITRLFEKYLKITAPISSGTANHCVLYSNRMMYEIIPSYQSEDHAVYLWDMNLGLPDSLDVCDISKDLNYEVMIPSTVDFNFYNKVFDIHSYGRSLYDTIYLEAEHSILPDKNIEIFTIGNTTTPLANPIRVTFKPRIDYSMSEKYALYSTVDYNHFGFQENKWENNEITISTKYLGSYTILEDTINPSIKPVRVDRRKVSFKIYDDLSGIKEYNASLNGDWILMHYDPKRRFIWSETLEPNNPLTGAFKLTVEDNAGNKNEYTVQIE